MKIATWNVNGIRARAAEVQAWAADVEPDIFCLQEIKATADQIPGLLLPLEDYWTFWHGAGGYSGVSLHVHRRLSPAMPVFHHPGFDREARIVAADLPDLSIASIYVPNGGRDYDGKLRFLEALVDYAAERRSSGVPLVLTGDLNVARLEIDVHVKERKPMAVGQRPEERTLFERLLGQGLVDVQRALHPTDDQLFTWWAPWRNMRQRNIGWRIDYVLASDALAGRASSCVCQRETGTSDHGPLLAVFS